MILPLWLYARHRKANCSNSAVHRYYMTIKIYYCLRSRSPEPSVFNGKVTKVIYFNIIISYSWLHHRCTGVLQRSQYHIIIIVTLKFWAHYTNRVRPNNAVLHKNVLSDLLHIIDILSGSPRYYNARRIVNYR